MSEELVPVQSLDNLLANQVNTTENKTLITEVASQNWIPALAICSEKSDAAKKKLAQPGDFVLGGQTNLGTKIEVVCLDYRIHTAIINDDTYMPEEEIYVGSDWKQSLTLHKEYDAFVKRDLPPRRSLVEGTDLFFFIPSATSFCTMWFKKTLARCADPVFRASAGGRLVELKTIYMENRQRTRQWYVTDVTPTKRALIGSKLPDATANIAVPADMYEKYYRLFKSPKKGPAEASDAAIPNRER